VYCSVSLKELGDITGWVHYHLLSCFVCLTNMTISADHFSGGLSSEYTHTHSLSLYYHYIRLPPLEITNSILYCLRVLKLLCFFGLGKLSIAAPWVEPFGNTPWVKYIPRNPWKLVLVKRSDTERLFTNVQLTSEAYIHEWTASARGHIATAQPWVNLTRVLKQTALCWRHLQLNPCYNRKSQCKC
jgi:hypothetical protein